MAGTPEPLDHARRACEARGLDHRGAQLIHHYSNAVVLIPREDAIARVAMGRHDPAQVRRSQELTRWLAEQYHYPTLAPLPDVEAVELHPTVTVSFWIYYPEPDHPTTPTSTDLGRLLAQLHDIDGPPVKVPDWVPLVSLEYALRDVTDDILTPEERHWLYDKIHQTRKELAEIDEWPRGIGLVHGDAWAGNLLSTRQGILLGDWDHVAHGPREIDLVPTWHAVRRYGKGPEWAEHFADAYGYNLDSHPQLGSLLDMRDLAQIPGPLRRAPHSAMHAAALRQRLTDIRNGNVENLWTAL